MISRVALYNLVAQRGLDRQSAAQLCRIAGLDNAPPALPPLLKRWTGLVAAGLIGMALILAVAANWHSLGRTQQFGLLQALVVLLCAGAALLPAARAPFALLGFLAIGGLFAFFGQTYQTGADPWQLFALWAGLGIVLPFCARSDTVWCAWVVVALTGVQMWDYAMSGHAWSGAAGSPVHLAALCATTLPTLLMTEPMRKVTGAGPFAWRLSVTLSAVVVTGIGVGGMFNDLSPQFWFALMLAAGAALAMASPRRFDVYAASIVGLALNILLNAGLGNLLFGHGGGEEIGKLMLLALAAAGLLAGTVRVIMQMSRTYAQAGEA